MLAAEGGGASPWMLRHAHLAPPGRPVLDLAAGSGRHARLFLGRGHPVLAVDIDTAGLAGLAGTPGLEIVRADLEGDRWPFAGRRFGAVVVANYLHRPLFPALLDCLAEDGVLLYETFALGNEAYGRPSNPEFLLRPGELLARVAGCLTVVAYQHGREDGDRPAVRQRIAAVRGAAVRPLEEAPR